MTAYEMRISDWSSDVCSSDLVAPDQRALGLAGNLLQARLVFCEFGGGRLQDGNPCVSGAEQFGETRATVQAGAFIVEHQLALPTGQDRKSTRLNSSH